MQSWERWASSFAHLLFVLISYFFFLPCFVSFKSTSSVDFQNLDTFYYSAPFLVYFSFLFFACIVTLRVHIYVLCVFVSLHRVDKHHSVS